jgi:uncharacterized damage-inducible protein DinB
MRAEMLRTLYGYNRWATGRILDAATGLTEAQWLAPQTAGRGSIRDTLVHQLSTQRRWLAWWNGSLPAGEAIRLRLDPADFPDVAAVRATWEAIEADTQAFVGDLTDEDADRVYTANQPDGRTSGMVLWRMMLHVANHGTQHRSEVAAMLTACGHSPGDLDLLFYPG